MKTFLIDGEVVTLASALEANSEDEEVCEYLNNANVGDTFLGQFACEVAKRIS